MNFYAFDFETASYDKHSACSIAIVKVVGLWMNFTR